MMVAGEISVPNMKVLAQKYMGLEEGVTVDELEAEKIEDKETFKRAVIKRWANMNSDHQVEVRCLFHTWIVCRPIHPQALFILSINVAFDTAVYFSTHAMCEQTHETALNDHF